MVRAWRGPPKPGSVGSENTSTFSSSKGSGSTTSKRTGGRRPRYLSSTLGLEVTRSVEFDRVEITLVRLVEGELPEYEVWVTDSPRNRVLFDNVLIARAPDVDEASRALSGLSRGDEEEQLRFWADALRSVAPDFLEGDDAPLREGEQVVRQRVAENPQELTIWLPSDASQEEEDRAREEAMQTAPPNVEVSVRRYHR